MAILLPRSVLECSPSSVDGVSAAVESSHREWGCELIQEAGILLRLPQAVSVTAQVLFTRFFYRRSLRAFDAFTAAMAALFLGAKAEEHMKRVRDVLTVFYHIRQRRLGVPQPSAPLQLGGATYQRWKLELIKTERFLLKELGFRLYAVMEHPHKFLPHFVRALGGGAAMAQAAWSFLNDSMRTDCCVRHEARVIACAAVYVAARSLSVPLPLQPRPWWELFETSREEMLLVCGRVLALYGERGAKVEKVQWLEPLPPTAEELDDCAAVNAATATEAAEAEAEAEAEAGATVAGRHSDEDAASQVILGRPGSRGSGGVLVTNLMK